MQIHYPDAWPTTAAAAIALQQQLRSQVITTDRLPDPIRHVAGVDAGFEQNGSITRAAVVVLSFPDLQPLDQALARRPTSFPYIPGLLSFREVPTVLEALAQLTITPDLLLCDGQGTAHPRRLGIACHLGLLVDAATIGVAKSRLVGHHRQVPPEKGAWVPLLDGDDTIGAVLRSRPGTKPLYISPGHRISLETALHYVLQCTPKYRLPETTRRADRLASDRKGAQGSKGPEGDNGQLRLW
ncbi:Endonuclease V [Halomicronema hongdechloris C2206]|uniref:Endonuclease V n=1 Tax=Halomicronema hongdechloris C2206 TaxID=1641165 RepID=A0A1Z3HL14_9CYAN|nr:deoxyribonuclease V [Halomicronema hongdechloris]ASC70994.1 Endonuclease V [Halomicronema hongdechloris C2206]